MALSLSNRFFWLAGIVFAVSDITGLLRLQFANNKYTYFVTTTIYTVAFLMLSIVRMYTTAMDIFGQVQIFAQPGPEYGIIILYAEPADDQQIPSCVMKKGNRI